MSNIETIIARDMALTAFDTDRAESPADAGTYTTATGSSTISAIMLTHEAHSVRGNDGEEVIIDAELIVQAAVVADPAVGVDQYTAGGITYRVTGKQRLAGAAWRLTLAGSTVLERSSESLRRARR